MDIITYTLLCVCLALRWVEPKLLVALLLQIGFLKWNPELALRSPSCTYGAAGSVGTLCPLAKIQFERYLLLALCFQLETYPAGPHGWLGLGCGFINLSKERKTG